jgi:beta-phosphoglucomutase-like phosphatase (HAD superfamily)
MISHHLKCLSVVCARSLTFSNSLKRLQLTKMGRSWSAPAEQKFKITHVIFDLDGTLIDSEEQEFKLHNECLKTYGKEFCIKEKKAFLGLTTAVVIKKIIDVYDLKGVSEDEYRSLYEFHSGRFFSDCADLPGADNLITHLHQWDIPMAFCTNSTTSQFELKTGGRYKHWRDMIPLAVIAGSDKEVKLPKPAPDPYLITMKRFARKPASPKNVLVFEDSLVGARAAIDSGATVIMIPQTHFESDEIQQKIDELRPQLSMVLMSMSDFKPEEFGLPPFN